MPRTLTDEQNVKLAKPNGRDILALLISLLEEQEGVRITYELEADGKADTRQIECTKKHPDE